MRIGVDLGGTKIELLALNDDGSEAWRQRVPTPSREGYDAILAAIARLVWDAEAELGVTAPVGVGTPGSLSPATGMLRGSNTVCLNGRPLDQDLSEKLEREVRIANDANCFALSEASDGAGAGAEVVFGVIVGTGTGGGVVVRGELLTGTNAIAGEWGHMPLPWPKESELPGPSCYCGRRGCIETWLSGPGIARDHQAVTGELIDAASLATRRDAGDPDATGTLDRHADRMARALAGVIDLLDPEVIVLGGGVSRLSHLYDEVPKRWQQHVFLHGEAASTKLLPAVHGDSSGVRGAAWLWPRPDSRPQRSAEK